MGKWATILKAGKYVVNNPATRSLGGAIVHPQRTLVGAGKAVKTATVGAGVGYLGWEAIVNDKPVVRTVSDVVIGSEATDSIVNTTGEAVDSIQEVASDAKNALTSVTNTANEANGALSGISDFLRNMCGGNAGNMFSNFFSNIGKGNVSGLSIVGLLAAGMLIFGRWGWLGKIGGALLAMLLIGNNSRVQQQPAPAQGGGVHR